MRLDTYYAWDLWVALGESPPYYRPAWTGAATEGVAALTFVI
jgi:hypothetical protein